MKDSMKTRKRAPLIIPDDPKFMAIYDEWLLEQEQERAERERQERERVERGRVQPSECAPLQDHADAPIEWQLSRPDPTTPKPPTPTKEELEELQQRRIKTRAELETITYWTAEDIGIYLSRERHWVKGVIDLLDFHLPLKKGTWYYRNDIFDKLKSLRIPTERRKLEDSLS